MNKTSKMYFEYFSGRDKNKCTAAESAIFRCWNMKEKTIAFRNTSR